MIEWLAASELGGLPGLPATEFRIREKADRESWPSRPREAVGGGSEYHISALPPAARLELARRRSISAARDGQTYARADDAPIHLPSATAPLRWQPLALARESVVLAYRDFRRVSGLGAGAALTAFVEAFNAGEMPIEAGIGEHVPSLSVPTLKRWDSAYRKQHLAGLAPKYGNRKGATKIGGDADLTAFVVGMVAAKPHVSGAMVMAGLRARFADRDLPTLRTVQRWVHAWKADNRVAFTAATDPDGYRSRFQVAAGSASEGITRLNQLWELDSTIGDLEVLCDDGRRYALIGCVDVYSRRAKVLVTRTSRAEAIAELTRRAILDWGVPEVCKTDQGRDYKSRHMVRVLHHLDIEHDVCPPFRPERKPHVERFFKTLQHSLIELLPGYVGHDVAERQRIRERRAFSQRLGEAEVVEARITPDELQGLIDRWIEDVYHHDHHAGLGGRAPFEVVADYAGPTRRVPDAEALAVVLCREPDGGGIRTVHKKGIRYDGTWFIAPELALHVSQQVHLLLHPDDAGVVYVCDLEGGVICEAVAPERRGISRREVALAMKRRQARDIAEQKAALRQARRHADTDSLYRDILVDRAKRSGKLAVLPGAAERHETPALASASRAAEAKRTTLAEDTPELAAGREEAARTLQAAKAEKVVKLPKMAPEHERFRRARRIERALDEGREVSEKDAAFLARYTRTVEYRSLTEFAKDFPNWLGGA